jgi:hypothetical protein
MDGGSRHRRTTGRGHIAGSGGGPGKASVTWGEDVDRIQLIQQYYGNYRVLPFPMHDRRRVLLELRNGRVLTRNLTYYPNSSKNCYQRGDYFGLTELRESEMQRLFPRSFPRGSTTLMDVALAYAGMEQATYKIGYRLGDITFPPRGSGTPSPGRITIRAQVVLFLTQGNDVTVVDLDGETRSWNGNQLNADFIHWELAGRLTQLIPILEFLAELAGAVAGGVGRGASRFVVRHVLLRNALRVAGRGVFRRLIAWLLRAAASRLLNATRAFAVAFLRRYGTDRRQRETLARFGVTPQQTPDDAMRAAIADGATAFAASLISSSLSSRIDSWVSENAAQAADSIVGPTVLQRVRGAISRQLIQTLTTRQFVALTRIIGGAISDDVGHTAVSQDRFAERFSAQGQSLLSQALDDMVDALADAAAGGG